MVYIRVDMETQPPITWSEPDPPQGEILRYDFRMRVVGSGRELKDTVYHRAISRETVVRFSTGRLTVEVYTCQCVYFPCLFCDSLLYNFPLGGLCITLDLCVSIYTHGRF